MRASSGEQGAVQAAALAQVQIQHVNLNWEKVTQFGEEKSGKSREDRLGETGHRNMLRRLIIITLSTMMDNTLAAAMCGDRKRCI